MLSLALAACGDSVPGNAVVRVDDATIKRSTFDHWIRIAAQSSQQPGSTGKPAIPDPPDFTKCVAAKAKTAPKPARGQPKPSTAQFKAQCKQEYEGLRDQVLQFLVQAEWIQGEAADQDVKVTDAEVNKSFQQQKKQSFPTEKEYRDFLRTSGMTQEDINLRVRLDLLSNKIRTKVQKSKEKITQKQITAYYEKNKSRFAQPERRDLNVVLTKTRRRARSALRALRDGDSWRAVAKRFSIDQASKDAGGKLPGVTPGQQEKAFDDAVFKAKKGQIEGPVKTQFGYYVFEVTKVTKKSQQTLQQATPTIRQLLQQQGEQKRLNDFVKDFEKKWKDRTNCRDGFVIQMCKNAPKPKRNQQTTPPGAVPQPGQGQQQVPPGAGGAPPQGAPPQGAPPQGAPPQGAPPQGAPPQGAPPQGAPPQGAP
ncbi:MAG TPA: peptidyl-prolyl cis-trans isomerase, partial [Solirubrobacteraceae bacterium]|nr:peptidyl-prolyl cis-trans isomerase [Solirubrobacteraceae bacterium]